MKNKPKAVRENMGIIMFLFNVATTQLIGNQ